MQRLLIPLLVIMIACSSVWATEDISIKEMILGKARQEGSELEGQEIIEGLNLKYRVQNMIEGFYDEDANGNLENLEVLYFLRDVLKAVEENGRFKVVSRILKDYDRNGDGRINKKEAIYIEDFLY